MSYWFNDLQQYLCVTLVWNVLFLIYDTTTKKKMRINLLLFKNKTKKKGSIMWLYCLLTSTIFIFFFVKIATIMSSSNDSQNNCLNCNIWSYTEYKYSKMSHWQNILFLVFCIACMCCACCACMHVWLCGYTDNVSQLNL